MGDDAPQSPSDGNTAGLSGDTNAPPPVVADLHTDNHHQAVPVHHKEKEEVVPRVKALTPRPTFMENLANSRDRQFKLSRQDSSELERYFVREPDFQNGRVPEKKKKKRRTMDRDKD